MTRINRNLTDKETQVLVLYSQGLDFVDIARLWERRVNTVIVHSMKLRRKLGASTIGHAIAIAYDTGILTPRRKYDQDIIRQKFE